MNSFKQSRLMVLLTVLVTAASSWTLVRAEPWPQAEKNAQQVAQAIHLANRNTFAWLAHADPATGLFPRNLQDSPFWNAQDCAADNYPFMVLTAYITDNYHLKQSVLHILAQEQKLANRVDALPDDFLFAAQKFSSTQPHLGHIIFGASEYAKDGLMPVTEWLGVSPWLDRMQSLIADIWKHAPLDSPGGKLPSDDVEVNGDLLQCMGRLYWLTGNDNYKQWCFRLADHHLLETSLLDAKVVWLRDHGCEIIGGLTETYLIAVKEDPDRAARYRPKLHALLDNILEHGLDENGLMYNSYDPHSGKPINKNLSDGWGYVFNAFLTVAMLDDEPKYRGAIKRALANVYRYTGNPWGSSVDDLADSVEGAINLINRLPDESAAAWIDESMKAVFAAQRPDGTMEGWHGDGNSTRTSLMYALWKTQGITASPWPEDLRIGAVREGRDTLRVWLKSGWSWEGRLRFDYPRHRDLFHMPLDYPRINQLPEWFAVDRLGKYSVQAEGGEEKTVSGDELLSYPVALKADQTLKLTIKILPQTPPARSMRYTPRSREAAVAWQQELRGKFFNLLKLADLRPARIPLEDKIVSTTDKGEYTHYELTLRSTPATVIEAVLTVPKNGNGPFPAVVCIHGHGGNRHIVYDEKSPYRAFAQTLAGKGFITISTDVGQHKVREPERTLIGERLWDLMRCVDYLQTRPEVDKKRIGCAGLSLGGEMAMWLGAMDERMAATVSCGYLTTMDHMELGHCMCWKFDGLRELADWADVYCLTAPRALQCQNGLAEGPDMFVVPLARQALSEIQPVYKDLGAADRVELCVHPGGHVVDVPSLLAFFEKQLKGPS